MLIDFGFEGGSQGFAGIVCPGKLARQTIKLCRFSI
jgi:hypothetical protein